MKEDKEKIYYCRACHTQLVDGGVDYYCPTPGCDEGIDSSCITVVTPESIKIEKLREDIIQECIDICDLVKHERRGYSGTVPTCEAIKHRIKALNKGNKNA